MLLRTLALLPVLVAMATAQSGSPLLGLAQGLSIDGASVVPGFTSKSVVLTQTKFDASYPVPPVPSPGQPDFSLLPFPPGIDIDALSLGYDWVLSDTSGVVALPLNHWGAITFSVRRTTVGLPGSVVAAEVPTPGGAAADIFAYVLPGSALPSPPTGVPFRAIDSTEINLDTPGAPANIDAHDIFIGLIYGENPAIAAILPPPTVYFSVTTASGTVPLPGGIPASWHTSPVDRSGATVFYTTWIPGPPGSAGSWSTPQVFLTALQIGITPGEDLDALALDLQHSCLLFSTDAALPPPLPTPPRDQLLYSNGNGTGCFTYRLPPSLGSTPVRLAVGLGGGPDDIDGICSLDPGDPANPSQIRLDFMLATPGNAVFPAPTRLQASTSRHFVQSLGQ